MSSKFVSAGGAEVKAPEGLSAVTDDAWASARKQVEEARKPVKDEGPRPGEQEGGVSLYEHLQNQKLAKQEAFEEATKLRNQFRPLDDGEVDFLEGIKQKRRNEAADVRKETTEQLEAFRKERAAAEELAYEAEARQEASLEKSKESEVWSTAKKRRRAPVHPSGQPVKARKLSPVPQDNANPENGATLIPQSPPLGTVAAQQLSSTNKGSDQNEVPADLPASKFVAGLVAYDSDSDG